MVIDAAIMARVVVDVRHDQRLALVNDPAGDALLSGKAPVV
jgi:hypothetical protein